MKWQLVPVEPTEEMLREIHIDASFTGRAMQARYGALLAAAPKPTAEDAGAAMLSTWFGENAPTWNHDELQVSADWPRTVWASPALAMPYSGQRYDKDKPRDVYKATAEQILAQTPLTIPGGLEWDERCTNGGALAEQLVHQVLSVAPENYAGHSFEVTANDGTVLGDVVITVVKPGGKASHELLEAERTRYRALVDLLEEVGVLQLEDDWARQIQALVRPESKGCPKCGGSGRIRVGRHGQTNRCFTCKPVTPEELQS